MSDPTPRPAGPRRRDRGSSLMLMPVAVLIFIILGAFAVDFSAARLARREMIAAAQGAAQDAAIAGLDEGAFYADGSIVFDEREARAAGRFERRVGRSQVVFGAGELRLGNLQILGRGGLALMKIAHALLADLRQIVLRGGLAFCRLCRDEIVLREQLLGAVDF